jgi:GntP family gluconate:H+ symporter
MYQVFLLAASIVLLLVFISKMRLHAFLALLVMSLALGVAAGLPLADVATHVAAGFGAIMQNIGIVIICGVIIGEILEATGGAHKIAGSIMKLVSNKRAPLAASLTGGVVSIPVFCDSGFVILNPVIKAISQKGNIPYMCLVTSLMGGLLITHCLVPPTPGPIAAAGILGADLGLVMVYGLALSIPLIFILQLWCNSKYLRNKYPALAEADTSIQHAQTDEALYPSTFKSYMPIVVPIILIVIRSFLNQYANRELFAVVLMNFIGTPYIALLIGVGIAFFLPKKLTREVTETWVGSSMRKTAEILITTGIAGSFGRILQQTGVGDVLANAMAQTGLPSILLPFVISSIVLIAQGSATVALTTTAAIILPMLGALGLSPELAVLAIGAGSFCGVLPSGSYFWCVTKLAGYDIKRGYVAVTLTTFVMGGIALILLFVLSFFI